MVTTEGALPTQKIANHYMDKVCGHNTRQSQLTVEKRLSLMRSLAGHIQLSYGLLELPTIGLH
jgi:hypothetical protein